MPSDPVVAAREMERLLRRGPRTTFDPAWFRFGDIVLAPERVRQILLPHVTERRLRRIEEILDHRTYSLAVAVEGMVDSGNVSALMRTAEAFGVQAFHAIDTALSYKHSRRTSQGAEKWLDRYRWASAADCIAFLRESGYRIIAAHLAAGATPAAEVAFDEPSVLIFGNELSGLSADLVEAADLTMTVPMVGFVQSFNISVAAGICLYEARADRIRRLGRHGDLPEEERERLRAVFMMKSVRHHDLVIERALGGAASQGAT
ncbi:MAG: TrmH family RNA methyltransferase [Acidimicrobiia bacterium]